MRAPQCMQNGALPFVACPHIWQTCTAGAAAAWPVTCAPHIEQKGGLAFKGEPQLGQLAGALPGEGWGAAADSGVPQCMQNGAFALTSPPQCEQREVPGVGALPEADDEYCV